MDGSLYTDEELEHAVVLYLAAPEGAFVAGLRGDGVEAGLPDLAGGGIGVFDVGAGEEGEQGDFGCLWRHGDWTLLNCGILKGIMDGKDGREERNIRKRGEALCVRYPCSACSLCLHGETDSRAPNMWYKVLGVKRYCLGKHP